MVKGSGKSSASSGTRKKHAKKAAGPSVEELPPPRDKKLTKQQRGQKKKEPRIKAFIPPVKPAPIRPDPLETTGLVHSLPPELLIVLRSFGKKAQVTKIRALEELQAAWVDRCRKEGKDGSLVYILVDMLPVWLHHIPPLFVHPSRRVRLLAASVHHSLLQIPPIREQIHYFLREAASPSQIEGILGTWCIAAHDVDRSVSVMALKSWTDAISFDSQQNQNNLLLDNHFLPTLISFIQRTILDPDGAYFHLNPSPPVAPAPQRKGIRQEDLDVAARSKAEEVEEEEQDRKARLRVGGLGALRHILESIQSDPSEDMVEFLKNPALWSSLYYAEQCSFVDVESFGYSQPNVRKSAWALVQTLLQKCKGCLDALLPILGPSTLRSAWVEPDTIVHATMWQPMLKLLKEFPSSWELERAQDYHKESPDDSDSEDEDIEEKRLADLNPAARPSVAYQEFLHFLELGCSGSPLQGYPTVVIIVSTIPSSVLASSASTPLADLFTSFWKVLDGRALNSLQRSATSAAFLSSLFECMIFLSKRLLNDSKSEHMSLVGSSNADQLVKNLVCEQTRRVWETLAAQTLKVEPRAAARLVAQTLISLFDIDAAFFDAAWEIISNLLKGATTSSPILVSVFLKIFQDRFKYTTRPKEVLASLIANILDTSTQNCIASLRSWSTDTEEASLDSTVPILVNMLDQFRDGLFDHVHFANSVDEIMTQNAFLLLEISPRFLLAYFAHRRDNDRCLRVWRLLLGGISQNPEKAELSIKPLLDAAQKDALPRYLKPGTGEVDALIDDLITQTLGGDPAYLPLVRQVLQTPDYFLSGNGYTASLNRIISSFTLNVDLSLTDPEVSLFMFEPSLNLIGSLFQHPPRELPKHDFAKLLPDLFIFAYLLPEFSEADHPTFSAAVNIWNQWREVTPAQDKDIVLVQIKTKLRILLSDTQVLPSPHDILRVLSQASPDLCLYLPMDIFPAPQEIDNLLEQLSPDPIHPSLAVITSLIPPADSFLDRHSPSQLYDNRGFSMYGRLVSALLQVLVENRQTSKHNIWALRHLHALEIFAQDFVSVPSASSPVFGSETATQALESLISKVEQVTTYILTSLSDEGWREAALAVALDNNKTTEKLGPLSLFLLDIIKRARNSENSRDTRILRNILQHVFHDVEKDEADLWILLARKIEVTAPQTSMAIVFSVTNYAPEPPRLDRYRNELAAALLGIPPSKANTDGLLTLRKLAATAPNPDSEVVFLPQPRAINVFKVGQQWIASDEDINEEVESAMTLVFFHLAPILQDIPGAHWDLIFDILESNLENSPITDDGTLVALARTLRLIILIQDLASANKSLRADWQERKMAILTMVRDLATVSSENSGASAPRSVCRALVLRIIQDLPSSLIDQETLPKMSHLVMDSSTDVQKMAYHFLEGAAKKRTEHFVIEAGVDAEATVKADLPSEILDILQRIIILDEEPKPQSIFGYLLGWMLLFDLFEDASLKVRTNYIEQLRSLDLIVSYFIPNILNILQLDQGPLKTFKLDIWAVDEFYIEYYDNTSEFSIPLLAAHLYYRALLTIPALIRTWVLDCKDRQLSSSITNYTSQYFSPVIIRTELAHVKSPEATALLVDENMAIKVASAVNEVVASYLVDEHQLEIKLKIPSDWPLHKIEIKDLKSVGVDENRWRAWMLAVQQIIWSHNGRIVDGLGLFKKNVTLHFEGQVECAICYSIISVMDGSFPRKPCRTCKNRFHAGCLYKWFNSSHSSSCPLCRSDIF